MLNRFRLGELCSYHKLQNGGFITGRETEGMLKVLKPVTSYTPRSLGSLCEPAALVGLVSCFPAWGDGC